jgi:hypothetical protein
MKVDLSPSLSRRDLILAGVALAAVGSQSTPTRGAEAPFIGHSSLNDRSAQTEPTSGLFSNTPDQFKDRCFRPTMGDGSRISIANSRRFGIFAIPPGYIEPGKAVALSDHYRQQFHDRLDRAADPFRIAAGLRISTEVLPVIDSSYPGYVVLDKNVSAYREQAKGNEATLAGLLEEDIRPKVMNKVERILQPGEWFSLASVTTPGFSAPKGETIMGTWSRPMGRFGETILDQYVLSDNEGLARSGITAMSHELGLTFGMKETNERFDIMGLGFEIPQHLTEADIAQICHYIRFIPGISTHFGI